MDPRLPPLVAALAAAVPAQTMRILPPSHAAQEGTSSTNVPFGRSTAMRVQMAYDRRLFAGPATITGLSFRFDGGTVAAQKQVECEIRMSTMALPLVAMAVDFAQNRGADELVVLPRQVVTLPGQTAAATPNPFLPAIPLAVPFAYDPGPGPLLLEIVVFGQPPGAYSLDVTWVCDSPEQPIGPVGCPQPGRPALRVESSTTQVLWGRPWTGRVLDAPAGTMVSFVLGTTETGAWNGLLLPFDLQPLGAPGCYLSIDVAAPFFSVSAADGSASFPFVIPNDPALVGEWLRFQGGAIDLQANPLGLVTSQAKKVQVCGLEPVARLWSTGISASTGTREIGVAPVVQLLVQL
jgi:hypothetical protein